MPEGWRCRGRGWNDAGRCGVSRVEAAVVVVVVVVIWHVDVDVEAALHDLGRHCLARPEVAVLAEAVRSIAVALGGKLSIYSA